MEKKLLSPDQLIEGLGGCGLYQIRLSVLIHLIRTAMTWSIFTMAIVAKTPQWWCVDDDVILNMTSESNTSKVLMSCTSRNGSACKRFEFDDSFRTIVSEFDLVCDKAYVPSTIMSIQLAGMLIGHPLSGQLADLVGRKRPLFSSLVILTMFNLIGIFSTHWVMFAVCRFFIGVGSAFFATILFNLMSEFTLAAWRPWIVNFPSWPIQTAALALVGWILLDWRYMHITCCIVSAICLLSWKIIPESFRWYLSHNRHSDAICVIKDVAEVNKQPLPDLTTLTTSDEIGEDDHRKYTIFHLFQSRYLAKVTLLCICHWFAVGFVTYGLMFGVQALSGNLFLNLVLFQITVIPVKFVASFLLNKIGRKKTSVFFFIVTCIGGFVVGIVQHIDTDHRVALTNGFAIVANFGNEAAWGCVQTITAELYPTVIRNIAFGSLSTIARLGSILGPQMVFLDTFIPGIMYFVCGSISVLCIITMLLLPETKGSNLPDKLDEAERVVKPD